MPLNPVFTCVITLLTYPRAARFLPMSRIVRKTHSFVVVFLSYFDCNIYNYISKRFRVPQKKKNTNPSKCVRLLPSNNHNTILHWFVWWEKKVNLCVIAERTRMLPFPFGKYFRVFLTRIIIIIIVFTCIRILNFYYIQTVWSVVLLFIYAFLKQKQKTRSRRARRN